MEKNVGIFLTGGGAKGAYHIGFFKALEDMNIVPKMICGSSAGALVGGAATYLSSEEMFNLWNTLTLENVLDIDSRKITNLDGKRRTIKLYVELLKSCFRKPKFLVSPKAIWTMLHKELKNEEIKKSKIDFGIVTTYSRDFKSKLFMKKEMGKNILDYIYASLNMPIFQKKNSIDNEYYFDIGKFRRYPIEALKSVKDLTDVIVVDIENNTTKKVLKDLKKAKFPKDVNTIIIHKNKKASILDFSKEKAQENFEEGYKASLETLKKCL